jgi:hypothetical protein
VTGANVGAGATGCGKGWGAAVTGDADTGLAVCGGPVIGAAVNGG